MKRFFCLVTLFFLSLPAWAANYACPMKCEGTKTYEKPGTCPVCEMDLEVQKEKASALNTRTYKVDIIDVDKLVSGKAQLIRVSPKNTADGKPVGAEAGVWGAVVSQDLSFFQPWKGLLQPDGYFGGEVKFPSGGNYFLMVAFQPPGKTLERFPLALRVAGPKKAPAPWKISGPQVKVGTFPGELNLTTTGESSQVMLKVKGKTLKFDPTQGHGLTAIRRDGTEWIEGHPVGQTQGSEVRFALSLPSSGEYKLWITGEIDGKPFTLPWATKR